MLRTRPPTRCWCPVPTSVRGHRSRPLTTAVQVSEKKRVASICTGAFILAAAGLLDGKRATTHWKVTNELAARHPVEEDHGPGMARDVARMLVVYMQRAGGQSQFSAPLQGPAPRTPAFTTTKK
ncbi:DJ-1/PfpI family protein [Actinoplanes sp. NPDC000266]